MTQVMKQDDLNAMNSDNLDAKKSYGFDVTNSTELEKDRHVAIDMINWEHSLARCKQTILIDSNPRRPNRLMATKLMDEELDLMMQLEEHCRKGAIHRLYIHIESGMQMLTPWLRADQKFQWPGDRDIPDPVTQFLILSPM
ncbi:hypothetical protein C8J56DRAFT_889449 [Mycena floridula]|nr:hypothetical protein C8J56DRAFT_889449 [Mycena floridula]